MRKDRAGTGAVRVIWELSGSNSSGNGESEIALGQQLAHENPGDGAV